ncbi:hypothetical protein ACH4A8_19640 [Streptomyces vietnamensis]|uniref:hypothetical protein n=1 Tax=Streptomyces vietnamensis TaxID=362257 RepID=UPI003798AEDF
MAAAPTTVTAEATVACAGDAAHPSAQVSFVGAGTLSCLTGGTTTGTGHIDWSNAAHSTSDFSFSLAVGARPVGEQILVATGTVSSGDYAGQSVTFTFQLLNTNPLDCLGDGISSVAGPIEAVFGA